MRKIFLLFLGLVAVTFTATAAAADAIRSFPIPTLEKLGQALYRQDGMAANAFDALFVVHPDAAKAPIKGWITEVSPEHRRIFFLQEREGKLSIAYLATFGESGLPKIEDKQGEALPDFVARRFAARRAAIDAIPNYMTKTYNFEVLDDPDGEGFLVYALASTKDPNEIVVGGHYRVTVSPDAKVEKIDALSRSLLILNKKSSEIPEGTEIVGHTMSHIVSDTPVETHVFASLLHKLPLYVTTGEHAHWRVQDGKITKMDLKK